jgi:hypothetical protein
MAERATKQGFGPNAFHRLDAMSRTTGVIDFPNVIRNH